MAVQRKNKKGKNSNTNKAAMSNLLQGAIDKNNAAAARQVREQMAGVARKDEAHRSNRGNRGGNLGNNSK